MNKILNDSFFMEIEEDIDEELLAMKSEDEIHDALCAWLKSTGGDCKDVRFSEGPQKGPPLRPVL